MNSCCPTWWQRYLCTRPMNINFSKEINSEVLLRWTLCTGGLLGFAVTCQSKDHQILHKCLLALSGFHHPIHIPSALPCAEFRSPSSVYTFRIIVRLKSPSIRVAGLLANDCELCVRDSHSLTEIAYTTCTLL